VGIFQILNVSAAKGSFLRATKNPPQAAQ